MRIGLTKGVELSRLVKVSREAFKSDIDVGAPAVGGPPGYDSMEFHKKMMEEEHLYTAIDGGRIVGGALFFRDEKSPDVLYIGRIFVKPEFFRNGFGTDIMKGAELLFPEVKRFYLDTPIWNTRSNAFYKKIGYTETKRDDEFVYYEKIKK